MFHDFLKIIINDTVSVAFFPTDFIRSLFSQQYIRILIALIATCFGWSALYRFARNNVLFTKISPINKIVIYLFFCLKHTDFGLRRKEA